MILFHNFLNIIVRYKTAFLLNVIGLGVALSIAAMVMMQIRYDFTFDSSQKDRDNIYMFTCFYSDIGNFALASRPLEHVIENYPGVTSVCIMDPVYSSAAIKPEQSEIIFKEKSCNVSENFTNVFNFDFTECSEDLLSTEHSAIIPESLAEKMENGKSILGKTVRILSEGKTENYTVTGIYKDFAPNSSLANAVYFSIDPKKDYNEWTSLNYNMFLKLQGDAEPENIINLVKNEIDTRKEIEDMGTPGLVPLESLHFKRGLLFDNFPKADFQRLMIFLAVAVLIIAVACINMANFNTALAPVRIKSINTMKILGSSRTKLCCGIIGESVFTCTAAWTLSLLIMSVIKNSPAAGLIDPEISFAGQYGTFLVTLAAAVAAGILSGIYPGLYITSFPAALALKGNFALSPKGRKIRSVLVGFQFTTSFILMSCIGIILLQDRYMRNIDLGFENSRLITAKLDGQLSNNEKDVFKTKLAETAGVENTAFANVVLSSDDNLSVWGRYIDGKSRNFNVVIVSDGFMDTIGADITEGRDFRQGDEFTWIFNECARKAFDISLDTKVNDSKVTGFISDMRIATLRQSISPAGFLFDPGTFFHTSENDVAYIRTSENVNMETVVKQVAEILDDLVPDYPFEIHTSLDTYKETYAKEQNSTLLIFLFGMVAIIISLIGVFGLVMFDGESRRKEIAIRKVLGARTSGIIIGFNLSYIVILAVCFAVSIPAASYFSSRWLMQFAERIAFPWWIFIPVFAVMSAVTMITVSGECWKIADSNPSENLKSE